MNRIRIASVMIKRPGDLSARKRGIERSERVAAMRTGSPSRPVHDIPIRTSAHLVTGHPPPAGTFLDRPGRQRRPFFPKPMKNKKNTFFSRS